MLAILPTEVLAALWIISLVVLALGGICIVIGSIKRRLPHHTTVAQRWREFKLAEREAAAEAYSGVLERALQELTTREGAITALRQAEAKYRSIFENAVEGIFRTTVEGRYLDANPALARIYGYESAEQLRDSVQNIERQLYVEPGRRAEFMRLMDEQEYLHDFESQVYRRDGSIIWIAENVHLVRDEQGQPLCYEGTVEDITERKQAENLRRAMEAAEAASEAKSTFLAHMSHEIRTPLNGVIGMLDLLASSELSERQARFAQIAKSSADSLLSLINQILDFSKIEAGKVELETLDFDLRVLVEDTLEMFGKRSQEKGIELACQISPRVPAVLRGDQDRLRQVLLNLVNNAVKFTERGEVVVRVGVEDELAEQVTLRIEVRDTGAGIAEELRSLLFQSFSQIDASTTRRFGGTGLGLAISKGLVELMGGTIGVDSAVNQGSIFWCVLPFQKQASGIQVRRVPEELRRLRVLAVDDNATNLEILSEQFSSWGLSLDVADEGLLALEKLRHAADGGRRYDLAILDVHMPGLNGLQLVRAIQQDPSLVDTKLIVLTSMDHALDRTEMGRLGLSGFIHKPVRQSRLLDAIVDATAKSVIEDRDIHSDQAVPRRASSDTRGKILIAEDNDINQIVVREILEQAGYGCELVSDGQAAAKAALSGQFDVVLMDCQMPVMDGFEAARLIRGCEGESTARRRVPIVALTANAVKGDRERCLEAGMDGYLSKPVDGPALIGAIEALMRQYDRVGGSTDHELLDEMISEDLTLDCAPNATKDETMTRPMAPNNTPPVINFDELLERCVGNLEVARRVMQRFIASGSTQVARLESALSHGDMPAVAASAHLLRGMAANLSAAPLATVCGELEESALRGEREVLAICLSRLKKALPLAQQAGADWLESMQVAAVD